MCAEGSPDIDGLGRELIFHSEVCDVYLHRYRAARGYTVAVWRGSHVAELTRLTDDQAARFDRAVRTVARAIERHYRPAKLNFLTLGNAQPHLHVHIVPRWTGDTNFMPVLAETKVLPESLEQTYARLRRALNPSP